VVAEFTDTY